MKIKETLLLASSSFSNCKLLFQGDVGLFSSSSANWNINSHLHPWITLMTEKTTSLSTKDSKCNYPWISRYSKSIEFRHFSLLISTWKNLQYHTLFLSFPKTLSLCHVSMYKHLHLNFKYLIFYFLFPIHSSQHFVWCGVIFFRFHLNLYRKCKSIIQGAYDNLCWFEGETCRNLSNSMKMTKTKTQTKSQTLETPGPWDTL